MESEETIRTLKDLIQFIRSNPRNKKKKRVVWKRATLHQHVEMTAHQSLENYCSICKKKFVNRQAYQIHMNSKKIKKIHSHFYYGRWSRQGCHKTFPTFSAMYNHFRYKHPHTTIAFQHYLHVIADLTTTDLRVGLKRFRKLK